MVVFLNGDFLPEEQATVSIFDRCFLYGDGLFETMRLASGKPYCWEQHWERLDAGARFLKIALPYKACEMQKAAVELAQRNGAKDAVLRLTLSRGVGRRGYSPRGADKPTIVMSVHPAPDLGQENLRTWSLMTSSVQLRTNDPLAAFKTCNRLAQVLARAEADAAGADEALLSNSEGLVVEGAASNLFWIHSGIVCT
ncbi:MAG: aminotransferase class IV, partial [Limisphaerales bacterium]